NPALISNWELGQRTPYVVDVAGILGALGVTGDDKRRILQLARTTDAGMTIAGDQSTPDHLAILRDCEAVADTVHVWHPLLIPDQLQIPDYSHAALTAQGFSTHTAHHLATIRADSGNLIIGPDATPMTAFLGEATITDPVAPTSIMARQLRFLDNLVATTPRLTIRIVPERIGWHPGLSGPFTLYTTPRPVAYFSHHGAGCFIPDDNGEYR
ncbi:DUF5753 domain-containing protein, partial [Amycolatopsis ultiminotia]|uniref:DUF5753 domain-containing protein n=1 Tax=Amycolatopsis ultiminotia TaxID=543629 RepID=UPI0031EDC219